MPSNADILQRLRSGQSQTQIASALGIQRINVTMRIRRSPYLTDAWKRIRLTCLIARHAYLTRLARRSKRPVTLARTRMRIVHNSVWLVNAAKYRYGRDWPEKLARRMGTPAEKRMASLAPPYIPSIAYALAGLHPRNPRSPWHRSNIAPQQSESAQVIHKQASASD